MDSNRPFRITPGQALHQEVMRQILEKVQDTPYILKGGAALVFTRNLSRHSADLDFDSQQRVNLEGRLRAGVQAAGVELASLKAVKDTGTVQRYKVHYLDPASGQDRLLKVETSFRQPPQDRDIETVAGIRTYTVATLFDMKMAAAEDRTQARDLFDLSHLVRFYGDALSSDQLRRAEAFTRELEDLSFRYAESFAADVALRQHTTPEDTAIAFRIAVEEQIERATAIACKDACDEVFSIIEGSTFGTKVDGQQTRAERNEQSLTLTRQESENILLHMEKTGQDWQVLQIEEEEAGQFARALRERTAAVRLHDACSVAMKLVGKPSFQTEIGGERIGVVWNEEQRTMRAVRQGSGDVVFEIHQEDGRPVLAGIGQEEARAIAAELGQQVEAKRAEQRRQEPGQDLEL